MNQLTGMKKLENRLRGKRFRLDEFNKHNKMNGVTFYLYDKGLKNAEEQHYVIKLYVLHMQWNIPSEKHVLEACVQIQEDFKKFVDWFQNHTKKIKHEAQRPTPKNKPEIGEGKNTSRWLSETINR